MIKDLGPCEVWYGGENLGKTQGGVNLKFTEESKPVNEDQKGVSNVDEIKVGISACEVDVPLTRASLGQLSKVIGGSSYTGSRINARGQVGVSMYDNAAELIIKPIVNNVASVDTSDWLHVPKAYPKVDFDIAFNNEGQRVYKTTFKGFPNPTTGIYWYIG